MKYAVLVAVLSCCRCQAFAIAAGMKSSSDLKAGREEAALEHELTDARRQEADLNAEILGPGSAGPSQPVQDPTRASQSQPTPDDPSPAESNASGSDGATSMVLSAQTQDDHPLPATKDDVAVPTEVSSQQATSSQPVREQPSVTILDTPDASYPIPAYPTSMQLVQQHTRSLRGSLALPAPSQSRQSEQTFAYEKPVGFNLVSVSASQHINMSANRGADIRSMRPGALKGVPDVVSFGIFAKGFYGANLKNNKYTVDSVLALKWKDPRVVDLIPAGLEHLTMPARMALKKMWMPEVVITNRDINKYDLISSSVRIDRKGDVFKVERATAVINQVYKLAEYPFDTQKLLIKVASSKYMLNEVVLEPHQEDANSGAKDTLMKGTTYELKDWNVFAFAETDGALKKSRGVLELTVDRIFDKYKESHLVPTCLLLVISWGVFWFPFQAPFITPRLAMSVLAMLQFTNLLIKSSGELPDGAPHNWNDILNQQVQTMMFCTITVNIFSEICFHQAKVEPLARSINHEAKVLLPFLSITLVTIVMGSGAYGWLSIATAGMVTKLIIVAVMGSYMAWSMTRLFQAQVQLAFQQEEKKRAEEQLKLQEDNLKRLEQSLSATLPTPKGPD